MGPQTTGAGSTLIRHDYIKEHVLFSMFYIREIVDPNVQSQAKALNIAARMGYMCNWTMAKRIYNTTEWKTRAYLNESMVSSQMVDKFNPIPLWTVLYNLIISH